MVDRKRLFERFVRADATNAVTENLLLAHSGYRAKVMSLIDAIFAEIEAQGFAIVPVEPTEAMIEAGEEYGPSRDATSEDLCGVARGKPTLTANAILRHPAIVGKPDSPSQVRA